MNEFFANWFELFSYFDGFSNYMYDHNLYVSIGFCMVLIPIVALTFYYYVINSRRFNRWGHWLLLVLLVCVVNFGIAFGIPFNSVVKYFGTPDVDFPLFSCCLGFAFIDVLWSFIISFVWSMIIKWGSSQCRRTPF